MQNKQIIPTLNCDTPHPRFRFEESPFYPNTLLKKWEVSDGIRLAGISSFGFGGTNCHMILEDFNYQKNSYNPTKTSLPATKFRRKAYWFGKKIVQKNDKKKDINLVELFEKLADRVVSEAYVKEVLGL